MDHHDEPLPHPNFALPGFAALVELTMLAQQMDQDEAIVFLEQRWVQTGLGGIRPDQPEANDGELRRDGVARRRPGRDPSPERDALRGNPAQAAQPADPAPAAGLQPITFDPDVRIATTLTARPADYAIKRIEARKHVPLWYFTREGLREAARTVRQADENDTLAVTKAEEGQVTVRSAGSLAASKNAKLDHQLTYNEFMYAKNLFLTAIDNAKWGDDTIDSFNWFFHHLDNHPIREEGERGEKALLLYASRARTDWHDKLALRKAYNIATINEDLLAKIARELDSREVRMNLEQVCSQLCKCHPELTYPLRAHVYVDHTTFHHVRNYNSPMLLLLPLLLLSPLLLFYRHNTNYCCFPPIAKTTAAAASRPHLLSVQWLGSTHLDGPSTVQSVPANRPWAPVHPRGTPPTLTVRLATFHPKRPSPSASPVTLQRKVTTTQP
ncbi:hypothetical protein L210DRAFT_3667152 [Boletus edulis BED1]|uniref:Uncharacterized protein n=1 Tax=Boletus edulis BED1 TaxID=1328754 RepID=A0AAD4BVW0_BOLED|nr:hypothetical protein L210DRAFT_3667152 [Boletus edulis BED1]